MSAEQDAVQEVREVAQAMARVLDVFTCRETNLDERCQLAKGHEGEHAFTWTVKIPLGEPRGIPDGLR